MVTCTWLLLLGYISGSSGSSPSSIEAAFNSTWVYNQGLYLGLREMLRRSHGSVQDLNGLLAERGLPSVDLSSDSEDPISELQKVFSGILAKSVSESVESLDELHSQLLAESSSLERQNEAVTQSWDAKQMELNSLREELDRFFYCTSEVHEINAFKQLRLGLFEFPGSPTYPIDDSIRTLVDRLETVYMMQQSEPVDSKVLLAELTDAHVTQEERVLAMKRFEEERFAEYDSEYEKVKRQMSLLRRPFGVLEDKLEQVRQQLGQVDIVKMRIQSRVTDY